MNWRFEIDLSMEYVNYQEDGDFKRYQKAVIEKIKASDAYAEYSESFEVYLQQLRDVTTDLDEWDCAFEDLYEFCDEHKIWIRVS